MKKIKFTKIAGWIATIIGANAIIQGPVLLALGLGAEINIFLLGLMLINLGQLFVGIRILQAKENARRTILFYQVFYALFMEIFNILTIPNDDFINNYGFLGVLIVPTTISLLIFLGRKEELVSSNFKII